MVGTVKHWVTKGNKKESNGKLDILSRSRHFWNSTVINVDPKLVETLLAFSKRGSSE